jgi:hypothetical protein
LVPLLIVDERRLESSKDVVCKVCRRLYQMGQGGGRRNKVTTRNEEVRQINTRGGKIGWNIYSRCHQKVLPRNLYIMKQQEYAIQGGQDENGLTFEGVTLAASAATTRKR